MNSESCLDCTHKHLCQAMIIHEEEVPLGYPDDIKRVIGHLAEATRHALGKHPGLALLLRLWRKTVRQTNSVPPYAKIIDFVEVLIACEKQNLPFPDLPEGLGSTTDPTPK